MQRLRPVTWMLMIVACALLLRLSAVGWGIPWHYLEDIVLHGSPCYVPEPAMSYQSDEYPFIYDALRFPDDVFGVKFSHYTTLVPYLVHTGCPASGFASLAHAMVKSAVPYFYVHFFGRLVVVLLGVATVVVVAWEARRRWGGRAAVIAALLLALLPYHVETSAYFTPDVGVALMVLLGTIAARRLWEEGGDESYLLAGIIAGLAAAAKQPGVCVIVALMGYHLMAVRRRRLHLFSQNLLRACLAAVAAFMLAAPAFVMGWSEAWSKLRAIVDLLSSVSGSFSVAALAGWMGFEHAVLLTPLLAAVVVAGFIVLVVRRQWEELPVVAMIVLALAVLAPAMSIRYLVLLAPLYVLAAAGVLGMAVRSPRRWKRWCGWGVVGVILVHFMFLNAERIWWRWNDPRDVARAFMERTIPAGEQIGLPSPHLWRYPFVSPCHYRRVDLGAGAPYVVVSEIDLKNLYRSRSGPVWYQDAKGVIVDQGATQHLVPIMAHLFSGAPPPPGFPVYERIAAFTTGGLDTQFRQLLYRANDAGTLTGAMGVFLRYALDIRRFRSMELFPQEVFLFRRVTSPS